MYYTIFVLNILIKISSKPCKPRSNCSKEQFDLGSHCLPINRHFMTTKEFYELNTAKCNFWLPVCHGLCGLF